MTLTKSGKVEIRQEGKTILICFDSSPARDLILIDSELDHIVKAWEEMKTRKEEV